MTWQNNNNYCHDWQHNRVNSLLCLHNFIVNENEGKIVPIFENCRLKWPWMKTKQQMPSRADLISQPQTWIYFHWMMYTGVTTTESYGWTKQHSFFYCPRVWQPQSLNNTKLLKYCTGGFRAFAMLLKDPNVCKEY